LFYLVSALPYVALEETRLHSEEELLTLISNRQINLAGRFALQCGRPQNRKICFQLSNSHPISVGGPSR
jgi:hypothetical protein